MGIHINKFMYNIYNLYLKEPPQTYRCPDLDFFGVLIYLYLLLVKIIYLVLIECRLIL